MECGRVENYKKYKNFMRNKNYTKDVTSEKVLVGMSGGVDSSVSVALLKKQGFEVEGLFVFFQEPEKMINSLNSAKSVAEKLNIKLNILDLSKEFKQEIVQNFVDEYKKGRTPNPCIRCNKYFKFGKLVDYALKNDFDWFATGHYARIYKHFNILTFKQKYKLVSAKDKSKDQVYFLYNLNQKVLAHVLFPLGNYKKFEVKKMAKKLSFPVHNRKESNDVCFIPNQDTQKFLHEKIENKPGDILDVKGKKVGEHDGLEFYTIGQRKGIKIGGTGPYYVVAKDFKENNLIVTNDKDDARLLKNEIVLENINWISGKEHKLPLRCLAQHRYQTKMFEVGVFKDGNKYIVKTKKPQWAVTPGQSLVLYKKRLGNKFEVLGGGVIK